MDDVNLDDRRERHWKIVFKENDGGMDDAKTLLHAKRCYIYINKKEMLIKGRYLVEGFGHEKKKVILEVVDDPIIEDRTDHEEIGLRGLISMFLTKMRRGLL